MILTNTPDHIRKMQNEMIMALQPAARGKMAIEMIEMGRLVLRNRLRKENPDFSDAHLRGEMFRCLYRDKFPKEKMEKIVAGIVDWHERHPGTEW